MTSEFNEFCERNKIIIFFLIPHTSHTLQYKHWHGEAIPYFIIIVLWLAIQNMSIIYLISSLRLLVFDHSATVFLCNPAG